MERWYVVYTQSRAEERALAHLRNQGFQCFLPRLQRLKRHARRTVPALESLFPRYVFARFDCTRTQWRAINGSRGVVSLLTQGPDPLPVAAGVVERLLASADAEHVVPVAALPLFCEGQKVCIVSGALQGQLAEVEELAENGMARVRLLMSLLGKAATLRLPDYAIEPV